MSAIDSKPSPEFGMHEANDRRHFRGDLGWDWMVFLNQVECWFGRGPSGLLLGPFHNNGICMLAVQKDIRDNPPGPEGMLRFDMARDLAMVVSRETHHSAEDDWPVWIVAIPDGETAYVITGPNGLKEGLFFDAIDASNTAIQRKNAYVADG